jgi:hypothetical protein
MLRPSAFILRREGVAVNRLPQPTGKRAGGENTEAFRGGSHGDSRTLARFVVSPTNRVLEAAQEYHHRLLDSPRPDKRRSVDEGRPHVGGASSAEGPCGHFSHRVGQAAAAC